MQQIFYDVGWMTASKNQIDCRPISHYDGGMKKLSAFKWTFLGITVLAGLIAVHSFFFLTDAYALAAFASGLSLLSLKLFQKAP